MVFYLNSSTNLDVIWHHTCISYEAFCFCGQGEVCGFGCDKIFKKHTRAVRECAEGKAIVRRLCGCAKADSTQILCNTYHGLPNAIRWQVSWQFRCKAKHYNVNTLYHQKCIRHLQIPYRHYNFINNQNSIWNFHCHQKT